MENLTILGKQYQVITRPSSKKVSIKGNKLFVPTDDVTLVKEFLKKKLRKELHQILDDITSRGTVDIFGDLDFKIVDRIGNQDRVIAKFRGNKIMVKLNAVKLPRAALKYIVAHEVAHISSKKHSMRFWDTLKIICPDYNVGKKLLAEFKDSVLHNTILS
jgi:predicted metal-dependent hydrolase